MKVKNLQKKIGILLCVVVLLNLLFHSFLWSDWWTEFFWYCNILAFALGIGLILNNRIISNVVLITSIPAQIIWILDFVLLTFGLNVFGRTAALFEYNFMVVGVSMFLHLVLIPTSLYHSIKNGFDKRSITYALLALYLLLSFSYFFTPAEDNINCVFRPCDENFSWGIYEALGLEANTIGYLAYVLGFYTIIFPCAYYLFYRLGKVYKL